MIRRRVVWLLFLFVAGTLTGTVLRHFEAEITEVVALSFFIPLLIGTGGNAGSQTVMTVIRSLALGEIRLKDARRVLVRELLTGVSLGLLVGAVALGHALATGAPGALALTVAATMLAICAWATTVGALVPILAQRVGLDPAVLSAPMIATLVDATGLVIYFTIAKSVLRSLSARPPGGYPPCVHRTRARAHRRRGGDRPHRSERRARLACGQPGKGPGRPGRSSRRPGQSTSCSEQTRGNPGTQSNGAPTLGGPAEPPGERRPRHASQSVRVSVPGRARPRARSRRAAGGRPRSRARRRRRPSPATRSCRER